MLFKYKFFAFRNIYKIEDSKNYAPFKLVTTKIAILGLGKGILITAILLAIDQMILDVKCFTEFKEDVFVNVVIGCLGMAGVILGLYCANISAIYSSKYANAPKTVSDAFQNDKLIQICMGMIIDYIIFGFIVIAEILMDCAVGWGTVFVTIFWSVAVIISYSIAGNRAYRLADVYSVADDTYELLNRIIINHLNSILYACDANFQIYFQKVCEIQIKLLNDVQRFGEGLQENNNAAMVQFMCKNIVLVEGYWEIKRKIARDSRWFRNAEKFQKWHLVNDRETYNALITGMSLPPKLEYDYWWLENEIFLINRRCITYLFKNKDYLSLYTYLLYLNDMCEIAIRNKEVSFFAEQINYLQESVKKFADAIKKQNEEENKAFSRIVELIYLSYLDIVTESGNYYEKFNIKKIISDTLETLDKGKLISKCKNLRGNEQSGFYNKIITEVQIEGRRLTPDWLVGQNVAREAFEYMNVLVKTARESIENVFELGQYFYDKKFLFNASIILMRFCEYESKILGFIKIIEMREKEFSEYQIDQAIGWEKSRIEELRQTIEKWKMSTLPLSLKCSREFAEKTWEMRREYPDFLGECYNHVCEDAIEAIIENNATQFRIDFENLSEIMFFYQTYIRADFLKKKDMINERLTCYIDTFPIVEWMQIAGLAILWGEFNLNADWRNIVDTVTATVFDNDLRGTKLAELIAYIQKKDEFGSDVEHRKMIEYSWKHRVAQAIRDSVGYQTEYAMFDVRLKTESKLLKSFCDNFDKMGFLKDPSEVYLVLCINPLLPDEKKFHTRYFWEEKMND